MSPTLRLARAAATTWLAIAASGVFAQVAPKYTNAEVLQVNAQQRLLVVRTNDGGQQTLELDDQVVGLADLRPGDRVILTLRGEPGRARVQAFAKAAGSDERTTQRVSEATATTSEISSQDQLRAAERYSSRLSELAAEASRVDGIWSGFRTSCNVALGDNAYAGSREWLSLWDAVPMDVSSGYCRDLFNQIVGRGQSVNAAMAAAETEARRSLEPGTIRDMQRHFSLEWNGWGRTPPRRLEQ